VRAGWLQLSYSDKAVPALHARARQWEKRGVPVEMLDRADVAKRVGTEAFAGAWLDGRAGAIQPMAYARGLVRAAQNVGAAVHGHTAVTALDRQGTHWVATTSTGATVRAQRVVIGTNGYTGPLWPGLAQTVLSANSFIVATEPLKTADAQAILARGETASTSQRLLLYFRKDAAGRLLMGGRGFFTEPRSAQDFAHLERSLERGWRAARRRFRTPYRPSRRSRCMGCSASTLRRAWRGTACSTSWAGDFAFRPPDQAATVARETPPPARAESSPCPPSPQARGDGPAPHHPAARSPPARGRTGSSR
jgi:glycine/D-amino acid oxidase-like deaminating enzyme